MRCERCDRVAAQGDAFCTSCGAPLAPVGPPCSACGRPGRRDDVFCTFCGGSLMPDESPPEALVRSVAFGEPVPFEVRTAPEAGLVARALPDDAGPVDRRLPPGETLILRRRAGVWAFVWASDGWMGWVREAELVDPDRPPE